MLAQQTALASAVKAAMEKPNICSIDPVMFEGFSLAGITAGQMAAEQSFRYTITHVVTAGSPIANFDIPPSGQIISLEFNQDPVARLDGYLNLGSANWTTRHADARYSAGDKSASPGRDQIGAAIGLGPGSNLDVSVLLDCVLAELWSQTSVHPTTVVTVSMQKGNDIVDLVAAATTRELTNVGARSLAVSAGVLAKRYGDWPGPVPEFPDAIARRTAAPTALSCAIPQRLSQNSPDSSRSPPLTEQIVKAGDTLVLIATDDIASDFFDWSTRGAGSGMTASLMMAVANAGGGASGEIVNQVFSHPDELVNWSHVAVAGTASGGTSRILSGADSVPGV